MQQESNLKSKKVFSSVGVQVNVANTVEIPSSNSRMSSPIIPVLCLGEVSGCTDSFSQLATDSDQSGKFNSSSEPHSNCLMVPKSFSSNVQRHSDAVCDRESKACGCTVQYGSEAVRNREKSHLVRETKGQSQRAVAQMSGSELTKLFSLILKDQDHVVPASPEEERSGQQMFKSLEKKISALKSSVNLHTFVSLLDMLLDKLPSNECPCQYKHNVHAEASNVGLSSVHPTQDSSVVPEYSEVVSSLYSSCCYFIFLCFYTLFALFLVFRMVRCSNVWKSWMNTQIRFGPKQSHFWKF